MTGKGNGEGNGEFSTQKDRRRRKRAGGQEGENCRKRPAEKKSANKRAHTLHSARSKDLVRQLEPTSKEERKELQQKGVPRSTSKKKGKLAKRKLAHAKRGGKRGKKKTDQGAVGQKAKRISKHQGNEGGKFKKNAGLASEARRGTVIQAPPEVFRKGLEKKGGGSCRNGAVREMGRKGIHWRGRREGPKNDVLRAIGQKHRGSGGG